MSKQVICPWCVAEGQRSIISIRSTAVTCMGWEPYYDEDGNYHRHDPNGSGLFYECSGGHEWTPAGKPCPSCDWNERGAQLFGRACIYGGTSFLPGTEPKPGEHECPECGQRVFVVGHAAMEAGRHITKEYVVNRHYRRVREEAPT